MKPWGTLKERIAYLEQRIISLQNDNRHLYNQVCEQHRELARQASGEPGTLLWKERMNNLRPLTAKVNKNVVRISESEVYEHNPSQS
jgi:predicted transglutaminase-like cysteine proteinase